MDGRTTTPAQRSGPPGPAHHLGAHPSGSQTNTGQCSPDSVMTKGWDMEPKTQPWPHWTQDLASSDHHLHSLPQRISSRRKKAGWEEQLAKVRRSPATGAFCGDDGGEGGHPLSPGRAEELRTGGGGAGKAGTRGAAGSLGGRM